MFNGLLLMSQASALPSFALLEIKIVVATILRRFKVALSPLSAKPIPSMQAVLKPMDGKINLLISSR
jgi:hypothetical protein